MILGKKMIGVWLRVYGLLLVFVAGVVLILISLDVIEYGTLGRLLPAVFGGILCIVAIEFYLIMYLRRKLGPTLNEIDDKAESKLGFLEGEAALAGGYSSCSADNFGDYLEGVISFLKIKSESSERKASYLLSRGVLISVCGIIFYLVSIVIWQLVWFEFDFRMHTVVGVVSCTLIFVFMEFLGAWYLRQYQNFIDVASDYMRVKSNFDRYMLAYLVSLHSGDGDALTIDKDAFEDLLDMLKQSIEWGGSARLSKKEINFAKEALDSAIKIVKSVGHKGVV
jgi:hypothetical protein